MDNSDDKKNQTKKNPRCDPKQLALLLKCSEKKDMTEWNKWREENRHEEIWLQEVDLRKAHLEGARLDFAHLDGANLGDAHLERAKLRDAHLEGAYLSGVHLEGASLRRSHIERANLWKAHLEEAISDSAHLEGANLNFAYLQEAFLRNSNLEGAILGGAHLEGAILIRAHLEGANFILAYLEGVDFTGSIVNGSTLFRRCSIDRKTDFRTVGLENCRIDEGTKYLLEYNKRRLNWHDWYRGESDKKLVRMMSQLLTSPVRLFWCMSDYGRSTIRILAVFLALAIVFAVAYWAKPDCVMVNGQVGGLPNFLQALYFSVVTMTTFYHSTGFVDIAANPQSPCGQVLLMLQVFCGYFLLGAIVTRLAILFTAGGPAGRFSKRKK